MITNVLLKAAMSSMEADVKSIIEDFISSNGEIELINFLNSIAKEHSALSPYVSFVLEKHYPQYVEKFKILITFS